MVQQVCPNCLKPGPTALQLVFSKLAWDRLEELGQAIVPIGTPICVTCMKEFREVLIDEGISATYTFSVYIFIPDKLAYRPSCHPR